MFLRARALAIWGEDALEAGLIEVAMVGVDAAAEKQAVSSSKVGSFSASASFSSNAATFACNFFLGDGLGL